MSDKKTMRIGMNPSKKIISDYRPSEITIAVLVNIPRIKNYFHHRFDVLKVCLHSIKINTKTPYDLLVFDNGSCVEVTTYLNDLKDEGVIDYLILSSRNIGKIGALKIIFQAAPGDIVAYSDDDIFFYPNWLSAHMQIMNNFPKVGMVSGWAIRQQFDHGNKSCFKLAETNPKACIERKRCIPEEWQIDFAKSTGRNVQDYLSATADIKDLLLHYNGFKAFATAEHFQFVSPKSVILDSVPGLWSGRLMGEMIELDNAVDESGYLRLSTIDRYVRHMGNVLPSDIDEDTKSFVFDVSGSVNSKLPSIFRRLIRKPRIRSFLRSLYNRLYWILNIDIRQ